MVLGRVYSYLKLKSKVPSMVKVPLGENGELSNAVAMLDAAMASRAVSSAKCRLISAIFCRCIISAAVGCWAATAALSIFRVAVGVGWLALSNAACAALNWPIFADFVRSACSCTERIHEIGEVYLFPAGDRCRYFALDASVRGVFV